MHAKLFPIFAFLSSGPPIWSVLRKLMFEQAHVSLGVCKQK